jgi:P-type Cu2+ transporter
MNSSPNLPEAAALEGLCFHCGSAIERGVQITAVVEGRAQAMCCHGCAAVAEAIEAAGLTDFYRQRATVGALPGAPPVPPEVDLAVYDDPRLWPGYVSGDEGSPSEVSLLLEGVTCQACVWLNERRLAHLPGVRSVQANYATRRLRVAFDHSVLPLSRILATVAELGYRATPFDETRALGALARERRTSLLRVGLAGLFSAQVMMLAFALYGEGELSADWAAFFNAASALLALPVVTWCAWPFYAGALRDLRSRRLGMDVPVALGVLAAFAGSVHAAFSGGQVWWDSATMFVFLLLTGRHLELLARSGAESASLELARMTPAIAHRLAIDADTADADAREEDVPVAALALGDYLRVRPGETIPVDGTVIAGASSVDQSLLTGESTPIARQPGDRLIGGTQNLESPLEMRVDAIGEATLLAGLGRLLERAQGGKSRVTELADRYAGWFIAAVLLLATTVLVHGLASGSDSALARTIAVLVATCPCALSLATPATVVAATTRWFRLGLLATRPHTVEALARARHFVFDKTGTLTEGRPAVVSIRTYRGLDEGAALDLAVSLAQASEHPLSRALVAAAGGMGGTAATTALRSVPGGGLTATVAGRQLVLGSPTFVLRTVGAVVDAAASDSACETGDTPVVLADENGLIAQFALRDRLRDGAATLIAGLRAEGCRISLYTGDAEAPARAVAIALGIEDVAFGLSPEEKLRRVQALTADGTTVAMVGDGVNDAPVLAAATVSVAMGQGTALARSAADAIFLGGNLARLLEARATSRKSLVIIRENLLWALAWNVGVLPAAAGGWLSAWFAALGMSMSSLLVVLNSTRVARATSPVESARSDTAAGNPAKPASSPPAERPA